MLQGLKGPDHHSSHHCPRAAVLGHIAMSGLMAWLISVTPATFLVKPLKLGKP